VPALALKIFARTGGQKYGKKSSLENPETVGSKQYVVGKLPPLRFGEGPGVRTVGNGLSPRTSHSPIHLKKSVSSNSSPLRLGEGPGVR